jgi:hypothetical protein
MLIDIGRVTGNLKHRTITMVSMRNVFKLMGARVVKGAHSLLYSCRVGLWTDLQVVNGLQTTTTKTNASPNAPRTALRPTRPRSKKISSPMLLPTWLLRAVRLQQGTWTGNLQVLDMRPNLYDTATSP